MSVTSSPLPPALPLISWTVYQNDVGVIKQQTIVDTFGGIRNLTGLSATLKIVKPGFQSTGYVNATIAITIPDPVHGLVQWIVGSTDLANCPPDTYTAFIVFTTGGYEEHTRSFTLFVMPAP